MSKPCPNIRPAGAGYVASALVLDTFDQLFIGHMLGAVAVSHSAVPMNIATRGQMRRGARADAAECGPARHQRMDARAVPLDRAVMGQTYRRGRSVIALRRQPEKRL
jgi:hypothetical protein